MSVQVQLQRFEGPLALLLYLIRKEEMDIFDINIHEITKQYLDYIKTMKKLDLEMAGEFVAMAATLIQIKSRMLLPQYNEDGEEEESEDPRKELVQKLLEYEKYKEAAEKLYSRPLLGRDIWLRGTRQKIEVTTEEEIIVEDDNALYALIKAYRHALKNMKKSIHKVAGELQSIASRVLEIKDRLIVGLRVPMSSLVNWNLPRRESVTDGAAVVVTLQDQLLVTFLSILELAKMGFVSVFQSENFSEIHIETKKPIERNVIERVEDYDSGGSELVAEQIIQDSARRQLQEPEVDLDEAFESTAEAAQESAQMKFAEDFSEEDDESDYSLSATDDEIFAEEERLQISEDEAPVDQASVNQSEGESDV